MPQTLEHHQVQSTVSRLGKTNLLPGHGLHRLPSTQRIASLKLNPTEANHSVNPQSLSLHAQETHLPQGPQNIEYPLLPRNR